MSDVTYFPKGKIVPNWVLRFKNNKKNKFRAKSNGFYVVKHKEGALYMYPENDGEPLITIDYLVNTLIETAPYTKYGSVMFNSKTRAEEALIEPVMNSRGIVVKYPDSKGEVK